LKFIKNIIGKISATPNIDYSIISMAFPAILENALHSLPIFAITATLGHINSSLLATYSVGQSVLFLFMVLFMTGNITIMSFTSRSVDEEEEKTTLASGIMLAIILSIVSIVLIWLFSKKLILFISTEIDTNKAHLYVIAMALTSPLFSIVFSIHYWLYGRRMFSKAFFASVVDSMVMAIVASILLCKTTSLLSIPIATIFASFARLTVFYFTSDTFKFLKAIKQDLVSSLSQSLPQYIQKLKSMLNFWLFTFLERAALRGAYFIFNKIVGMLGATAIAAQQVAIQVESLMYMPYFGIALVANSVAGKIAKGNQKKRFLSIYSRLMKLASITSVMGGIILFFVRHTIAALFSSDPQVIALAAQALIVIPIELPTMCMTFVLSNSLRALNRPKLLMLISTATSWGVRVCLGYTLAIILKFGLLGVWIATTIEWSIKVTVYSFILNRMLKSLNVTK